MTISAIPAGINEDDGPGIALVGGLIDVATWYAVHTDTLLPVPSLNIPVPAGEPGARLTALGEIAGQLGVDVAERDGMLIAERKFGAVTLEAHLVLRSAGASGHRSRPARGTARTGSGAAA